LLYFVSKKSRFGFCGGYAGEYFRKLCLKKGITEIEVVAELPKDAKVAVGNVGDISLRGYPFKDDLGRILIPTFSPQDVVDRKNYFGDTEDEFKSGNEVTQRKNWKFWFEHDLAKAWDIYKNGLQEKKPTFHICDPEATSVLAAAKNGEIFLDIETTKEMKLICIGFALGENDVYVVEPSDEFMATLKEAVKHNLVVIHNAMFDAFILRLHGIKIPRIFDTMIAHHRVFPEVEKSLSHCITLYTHLPYHKSEYASQHKIEFFTYNAKDVFALTQIKPKILEAAKKIKAEESIEMANRMIQPYLEMSFKGMRVDFNAVKELSQKAEFHNQQIMRIIKTLAGKLNPLSPKQVKEYLVEVLGFKDVKKTGAADILSLLRKHREPILYAILRYRENMKVLSKLKFEPWLGDRFTCSWKIAGTTTFRLGSSKLLDLWGDNAQNFDKELRKIIIPDDGKVFIQADQSGAEALIVAYLCPQGPYRRLFTENINPHVFLALHLFKEKFEEVLGYKLDDVLELLNKHPKWEEISKVVKESDSWPVRYYFIAKQCNHSLNYNASYKALAINTLLKSGGAVNLSFSEAASFVEKRKRLFPEIQLWHSEIERVVRNYGILRNLFGHPRLFTGWNDNFKEAYAFIPQSTVAQITNYAVIQLYEAGIEVVNNCHDSILIQVSPTEVEEAKKLLTDTLCRELVSPRGEKFKMKCEVKVSDKSWYEA
jgi:DNA polymerase I-like protein with 3'-5' exonuclease and polymerase domains